MAKVVVEIPDDIVAWLKVPETEAAQRIRRETALRLYEKGIATFGQARRIAKMTHWAFHNLLGEENVARSYDTEEFEKDRKTVRRIR
jgi:predicted HTH domain antitoxin